MKSDCANCHPADGPASMRGHGRPATHDGKTGMPLHDAGETHRGAKGPMMKAGQMRPGWSGNDGKHDFEKGVGNTSGPQFSRSQVSY